METPSGQEQPVEWRRCCTGARSYALRFAPGVTGRVRGAVGARDSSSNRPFPPVALPELRQISSAQAGGQQASPKQALGFSLSVIASLRTGGAAAGAALASLAPSSSSRRASMPFSTAARHSPPTTGRRSPVGSTTSPRSLSAEFASSAEKCGTL